MVRLVFLLCLLVSPVLQGQEETGTIWRIPAPEHVEGQAWTDEISAPYSRLPKKAEALVRKEVWDLSKHSAGLSIRFVTNASEITVRFGVEGNYALNHMPATGVSGVDLYAVDSNGKWLWCRGDRSFKDTITYQFKGLKPNDAFHKLGREYRLSLPLYNQVNWIEIGVSQESYFEFRKRRKDKPIVVYGTSIAQGACASRPGMAWTNILGRKMDRPLINLAFSGNGRLEKELIELLAEIDAKLYILDCLPNLWNAQQYNDEDLENKITNAIKRLKQLRPETPILLTAHGGYTDGFIQTARRQSFNRVNNIQKKVFNQLMADGISELYYLSYQDLALELDDMVDGTHPNDLGMMHYAKAYEHSLRKILHEPKGIVSTTKPVTQRREPQIYEWEEKHGKILGMNEYSPPQTVILANSIVHFWGGLPKTPLANEQQSWEKFFNPKGVRNYAYGWDRIENVLWRVYHGELDGFKAKRVLVMIGTNNLHLNTDDEIVAGLKMLMKAIKLRQPTAQLLLMGILPRRELEDRVAKLNVKIEDLAKELKIRYADLGADFLGADSRIQEGLFSDGLHPNKSGYLKLRKALMPIIIDP